MPASPDNDAVEGDATKRRTPDSLAVMVAEAFAHPIDFPPLDQAVVPDDRLAIAITADAGQWVSLLPALLGRAAELPISVVDVVIAADADAELMPQFRESIAANRDRFEKLAVNLIRHDPTDRTAMSYLAADTQDFPIYIAKSLADADVVLPVSVPSDLGSYDDDGGLYPGFIDRETIIRCQEQDDARPNPSVAWSLGVQVQLVVIEDQAGQLSELQAIALRPSAVE